MSFNQKELRNVKKLCAEVTELATKVQIEIEDYEDDFFNRTGMKFDHAISAHGSKTTGALRRKSLDLTRALADLRRHN